MSRQDIEGILGEELTAAREAYKTRKPAEMAHAIAICSMPTA